MPSPNLARIVVEIAALPQKNIEEGVRELRGGSEELLHD
jgi:hypothetical protein